MKERRRYPRVDQALELNVVADKKRSAVKTLNVSCGGALLSHREPIELMTKMAVSLTLPKRRIKCHGVVVRCDQESSAKKRSGSYLIGVAFLDLQGADRRALAEHVLESMMAKERDRKRS